jgi:hypothetical protein
MTTKKIIALTILSLGVLAGVTELANAQAWEDAHPRRAQALERLDNQHYRINRQLREGEISPREARELHAQDRFIREQERFMARQNGGYITPAQQRALSQQEDAVSRAIGR